MPIIHHHAPLNVLVSVRGHPFDRTAFDALFQDMADVSATMVDQPAAARLMTPEGMRGFDALVLYDMPGLDFEHPDERPGLIEPPEALRRGFEALLRQGTGVVALHHALAGWPTWTEYHDWLGGQFHYRPVGDRLDSGYRHAASYEAQSVAPGHPVLEGVPSRFAMVDELYLVDIDETAVTPLLRADYDFSAGNFYSAAHALAGRMNDNAGWPHPPGSNLIGWAKMALQSRLVYLQPGDAPPAYDNPAYRRLVRNAIGWVCGRE